MQLELIEFIRRRPWMFDVSSPEYKNIQKKSNAWLEISRKLNLPVEEVQSKWRNLRSSYVREKRKMKLRPEKVKKRNWAYLDILKFLEPHIKNKSQVSSGIQKAYAGALEVEETSPNDNETSFDDCHQSSSGGEIDTAVRSLVELGAVVHDIGEIGPTVHNIENPRSGQNSSQRENSFLVDTQLVDHSYIGEKLNVSRSEVCGSYSETPARRHEKTRGHSLLSALQEADRALHDFMDTGNDPNAIFLKGLIIHFNNLSDENQAALRRAIMKTIIEFEENISCLSQEL